MLDSSTRDKSCQLDSLATPRSAVTAQFARVQSVLHDLVSTVLSTPRRRLQPRVSLGFRDGQKKTQRHPHHPPPSPNLHSSIILRQAWSPAHQALEFPLPESLPRPGVLGTYRPTRANIDDGCHASRSEALSSCDRTLLGVTLRPFRALHAQILRHTHKPLHTENTLDKVVKMLDVIDFIAERGGNPEKIRESQRRRHAPVEIVDEIIALWEDHRKSMLCVQTLHVFGPATDTIMQPTTPLRSSTARSTRSRSRSAPRRRYQHLGTRGCA